MKFHTYILMVMLIMQTAVTSANEEAASYNGYGIAFEVPKGMHLFTKEKPGKLRSLFNNGDIVRMVNMDSTEENISIKQSGNARVTHSDVLEHFNNLTHQSQLPIPGYKRISLKMISIGANKSKQALEHIYNMTGNVKGQIRQMRIPTHQF